LLDRIDQDQFFHTERKSAPAFAINASEGGNVFRPCVFAAFVRGPLRQRGSQIDCGAALGGAAAPRPESALGAGTRRALFAGSVM
jgi:hypothetical protein